MVRAGNGVTCRDTRSSCHLRRSRMATRSSSTTPSADHKIDAPGLGKLRETCLGCRKLRERLQRQYGVLMISLWIAVTAILAGGIGAIFGYGFGVCYGYERGLEGERNSELGPELAERFSRSLGH